MKKRRGLESRGVLFRDGNQRPGGTMGMVSLGAGAGAAAAAGLAFLAAAFFLAGRFAFFAGFLALFFAFLGAAFFLPFLGLAAFFAFFFFLAAMSLTPWFLV